LRKTDKTNFKNLILNTSEFILTCHERPDADAVSSMVAMNYLLQQLGKNVICALPDEIPEVLKFIDYNNSLKYSDNYTKNISGLSDYTLLVLDTNDPKNTGIIEKSIMERVKQVIFIDHHSTREITSKNNIIIENASSTCEIIYFLFKLMKVRIPVEIGDALYSGIIFDTGSFHYPKTSSKTFKIAAELVQQGTEPNRIYRMLFERNTVSSLRIHSKAMQTLEILEEKFAFMYIDNAMIKSSGASEEETERLINIPLLSLDIVASIIFKERSDGVKKVSLRSKGNIDVAKFAMKYNGGGHKNASGFKMPEYSDFQTIKNELVLYLRNSLY